MRGGTALYGAVQMSPGRRRNAIPLLVAAFYVGGDASAMRGELSSNGARAEASPPGRLRMTFCMFYYVFCGRGTLRVPILYLCGRCIAPWTFTNDVLYVLLCFLRQRHAARAYLISVRAMHPRWKMNRPMAACARMHRPLLVTECAAFRPRWVRVDGSHAAGAAASKMRYVRPYPLRQQTAAPHISNYPSSASTTAIGAAAPRRRIRCAPLTYSTILDSPARPCCTPVGCHALYPTEDLCQE